MTSSSMHSRGSSHNSHDSLSSSNASSSYQLILDHVFSCPASYELPLRTVFAHNSNHHLASAASTAPTSPIDPPDPQQQATADFTSALMSQIARLPNQPCTLPTSYICGFLRKCFTEDLLTVDFPQALTGLDYLKDLETKRKREIHAACDRLGVDRAVLSDANELARLQRHNPNVSKWLDDVLLTERTIESLYTNLYVGIRRWIIINELMITPFNRHNCFAMLNTLYPPAQKGQIGAAPLTSKLTPSVLSTQREAFFVWIKAIEKGQNDPRGPRHRLQPLLQQGKRLNSLDENGWPAVRESLDRYLRLAQSQTDTCAEILSRDDIDTNGHKRQVSSAEWDKRRKQRKADSGVSFNSDRPSTSGSLSQTDTNKALPAIPPPKIEKQASTLERLARELRRMKGSRTAANASFDSVVDLRSAHSRAGSHASNGSGSGQSVNSNSAFSRASSIRGESRGRQEDKPQASANSTRGKSLRKLRSFGDIRSGRSMSPFRKNAAPTTPADEAFDEAVMRRQRENWEAGAGRHQ